MTVTTKVDLGFNRIARLSGPDDLARLLFPGNRNHQRVFLAIFVELKYAEHGRLPSLGFVVRKYGVSARVLQRVRAKCRRLGLIDHVSRFSAALGYREGWVLSSRIERALDALGQKVRDLRAVRGEPQERQKDFDALRYL